MSLTRTACLQHKEEDATPYLLKPVSTSCTLGLSTRQHSTGGAADVTVPTLGVCLHADMSAIDFAITNQQLSLAIAVSEQLMSSAAQLSSALSASTLAADQAAKDWIVSDDFGDATSGVSVMPPDVGMPESSFGGAQV